jgi:hypothetical protein
MDIAPIELTNLALNPHNDRHGPLKDEASAIQWLLENRTNHMRTLAQDLAATKRLYEYPLVQKDDTNYIVFDGNRRVCCLKLLCNPKLAPSERWFEFFSELRSDEIHTAFSTIECEVEPDIAVIDEKLYRRHTGSQEGVGQSQWDPEGKSFFLLRTGKGSVGFGEAVEKALKAEQLISSDLDLPWSNLERLMSSEPIRKRVGISFSGGVLTCLTDKTTNLRTLQRIAQDLSSRRVVLGDLWNNEKKGQYLDRLKNEGLAIDVTPSGRAVAWTPNDSESTDVSGPTRRHRTPKDRHLISSVDQNPFVNHPELERAEKIWRELQFTLEFEKHDNAIAVLMRVLLELSIVRYGRQQALVFSSTDTFARRVSAVADSMLNRELIDVKARSIIRKFENDKPIVSAHSMHQYVHSQNLHPAKSDMKAIWNVIRSIIINSVK